MSGENPFVFTRENCEVVSEFARSNSLLKDTLNSKTHWNKLVIRNGTRYLKNDVLLLIAKAVYPEELSPCLYQEEHDDTSFLFRNGFAAVMTLCSKKLKLIHPETNENIELVITARHKALEDEPFDPLLVLNSVVAKRVFDGKNIDLRNLRNDAGLQGIYCDFRSRSFCKQLFGIVGNHVAKPHLVLMSHNQIERLDVLEGLHKYFIAVLDLRHNLITREGFNRIHPSFSIGHLLLEGNPITTEYDSLFGFARDIRKKLNWLSQLDFMTLSNDSDMPINVPTFLRKRSFKSFVDHFLFHYFTLLFKNKEQLAVMYHPQATFTMSLFKLCASLLPTPQNTLATAVDGQNHNILREERGNRSVYQNVFIGQRPIIDALKRIPNLECSFSQLLVDVPIIVSDVVMSITCSGACRMVSQRQSQQLHHFSRTFILVPSPSSAGEWVIANDMWNISQVVNASSTMLLPSCRMDTAPIFGQAKGDYVVMLNPQMKDRTVLRRIVKNLTKMKPFWVERFLEESDWDLEFTLQAFTDQFKADVIPVDAFDIPPQNLKILGKMVDALKRKQAQLGIDV